MDTANRIIVTMWRENGQGQDRLELSVAPAGMPDSVVADIRAGFTSPDELSISGDMVISDGEIVETSGGRRFRVEISEI